MQFQTRIFRAMFFCFEICEFFLYRVILEIDKCDPVCRDTIMFEQCNYFLDQMYGYFLCFKAVQRKNLFLFVYMFNALSVVMATRMSLTVEALFML